MEKLHKTEIAKRQLISAVEIFLSDGELLSVITLVGASEEVFGKFVSDAGKETALDFKVRTLQKLGSARSPFQIKSAENDVRNALKHANKPEENEIEINVRDEAISMLSRALVNFMRFNIAEALPFMQKVYDHIHKKQE